MSTFTLTIDLGNEAMSDNLDVAAALRVVADGLVGESMGGDNGEGIVRDVNGNRVGSFSFDDGEQVEEHELELPFEKNDRVESRARGAAGVCTGDERGRGDRNRVYAGSKGWVVRVLWDDGSEYDVPVPALRREVV